MHPVMGLEVGPLHLYTSAYRFFFLLAAVCTVGLALAIAGRRGLPAGRTLLCLLAMAAAVPTGARLLDAATKGGVYAGDPGLLLSADLSGLSLFGGLLAAAAVAAVVCRALAVDLVRLADSTAPALGVGIALMRLGCFAAGCCFGEVTDLPWGVAFPVGSDAHLHQILAEGKIPSLRGPAPVHPTQLYEAAAALAGSGLAAWLVRRRAADGAAFLAFVLWYDLFRVANHFWRVPGPTLAVAEWFYPVVYATIVALAGAGLVRRWRHWTVVSRKSGFDRAGLAEER